MQHGHTRRSGIARQSTQSTPYPDLTDESYIEPEDDGRDVVATFQNACVFIFLSVESTLLLDSSESFMTGFLKRKDVALTKLIGLIRMIATREIG